MSRRNHKLTDYRITASSVICHRSSVICHLSSALALPRSSLGAPLLRFVLRLFNEFEGFNQVLLIE